MNTNLLRCFSIDEDRATANGKYPAEYVQGVRVREWDEENNRYKTDTYKCIRITAYFHFLGREKIDVNVPLDALSKDRIEELNKRSDAGEVIQLQLDGLTIGLRQGYKDIALTAKADNVSVMSPTEDIF